MLNNYFLIHTLIIIGFQFYNIYAFAQRSCREFIYWLGYQKSAILMQLVALVKKADKSITEE